MDEGSRARLRAVIAALNLAAIAVVVPAILYRYVFAMPQGQAPGARGLLVGALAMVWLALAARPLATPSGKPWPFPLRAAVLVGGNLSMAVVMWLWQR